MKFITFTKKDGTVSAGWINSSNMAVDMHEASNGTLPDNMLAFIENHEAFIEYIEKNKGLIETGNGSYPLNEVSMNAPLPNPKSVRDFYAFEQHVKTARENRGLEMIPEWYEFPVFYFTNHLAIKGPEEDIRRPQACEWMDYELEIACVIGKEGRNIKTADAEQHIFGFFIMNDWSARDLQRQEMKVGLGPAKGKDFATSFGPYLVTKDEVESLRVEKGYDLEMIARVNGRELSKGNMKDLYYSFGEMIERASAGTTLYPGEVIGSGTVGTGCILELGTDVHRWLEPGDEVELEITGLGVLKNKIIEE
ncbi:fumarylacetoacetate hydrolase family protein [Mesobacillus boroniphilus]|uniref:Fumarylacetoacetate hydrolase family protein n=1 Tax=Mesobacillus boroniphilus TaxID=308892 RepID=A0A944CIX6_9BACI|nr:fumarylacetoacetate hydrolase family protein [Mesobacillus boroniphilus]MBS8263607.1 fumarylacetoacetate hydrolase family protein [Mesobacillus boroniphilus]